MADVNAVTRIEIKADDNTAAAFASAKKNASDLESSFAGVARQIAGLAGVTFAVNWARDVVAAAAALDDLSDATGSSVEELSKLANIAKVSGASFDTIDAAIKKLAVGLGGVDDESAKASKALQFLGVQSRDPAKALQEVAVRLNEYADGAGKAAIAVALFGRGGASLLPVLKDIAENQKIAATVTAKQAEEAERLEKAWRTLSIEGSVLKNTLLNLVVPAIEETISAFNRSRQAGLGFFSSLMGPTDMEGAFDRMKRWEAEVVKIQELIKDAKDKGYDNIARGLEVQLDNATKKLEAYRALYMDYARIKKDAEGGGEWKSGYDLAMGKPQLPANPLGGGGTGGAKQAVADYADEIKRLSDIMAGLSGAGGAYPQLAAAHEKYIADLRAGKQVDIEQVRAFMQKAAAADQYTEAAKRMAEWQQKSAEYAKTEASERAKYEEQQQDSILAMYELANGMEAEVKQLGLSNEQRELSINLLKLENSGLDVNSEEYKKLADRLRSATSAKEDFNNAKAATEAATKAAEEWQRSVEQVGNSLTDALLRGFESGKDMAKNFRDSLVNLFKTLVLKPIIQMIVMPVASGITGMLGLGSSGSAAAGGLGGVGNLGSSLFGGFTGAGGGAEAIGSFFGMDALGAGAFAGGMGSPLSTIWTLLGGEGGAAIGAGLGLEAALGAAIPVLGIVAAIAGLSGMFGKKGGPKSGGAASNIPGFERFFTPNQGDAQMQTLVEGTTKDYQAMLKNLGASIENVGQFAFGYDTDPQGTAQSRISAAASVNGKQVYYRRDQDIGRDVDPSTFLALEAKRALLAALKASELPTQIANVFNTAVPESMSSEQIDNLLAFGQAMKAVVDAIGGSVAEDATKAWADAQKSSIEKLRDMGDEVNRLATETDGTAESMQALGTATVAYRQAAVQLLVAIEAVRKSIGQMFDSTREQIQLAGLSGEQTYQYYNKQFSGGFSQIASASSPEELARIAEELNRLLTAGFGTLDQSGQLAKKDEFLALLDSVNKAINERLTALGTDVTAETSGPLANVGAALDTAATSFTNAATTQVNAATTQTNAADTMLRAATLIFDAANTPQQVIVNLNAGAAVNG